MTESLLDVESLRRKYAEERDRRLEVEDRSKYIYLEGELARRFDTDPWAPESTARDPVDRETEVVVVGGGFAGMTAGASLRKRGLAAEDICLIEKGADFGGTWYWNRYPGLSCDTESYCYLPLLEETGYIPKQKYSMGPEILEHCQRIGRHFGLYDRALLQTRVTDARWDEAQARWIITTDRGDRIRARYFWICGGYTNRPKLPGIKGVDDFQGHCFHTMRWDYGYTGGGPGGDLEKLADKRVALIGTGATAIQCVPPLGRSSGQLFVFQRTPSAVNVRANRATDPAWSAALEPGWQMRRMENFLNIVSGTPEAEDLVDDAWTWNFKHVRRVYEADKSKMQPREVVELADFRRMQEIRDRVDSIIRDPATAEGLKAWYGLLCKRPTFHDEYLQTFNLPNVTLVDTGGRGIERITADGVVANGREYLVDCIIFGTGFDTTSGLMKGMALDPVGRDGITLSQRWTRDFSTLHGLLVSDFPNMFLTGGAQGTQATTMTYGFTVQSEHCARIVEYCRANGHQRLEVKPEAESRWRAVMEEKAVPHQAYYEACTPGYINLEGGNGFIWQYFYGAGPVEYRQVLDRWFEGDLERDLALDSPASGGR